MELPDLVFERLKVGRVMLFLGAGASSGSGNREGEPPLGAELARRLSEEAKIAFDPDTDTLGLVSVNAKSALGDLGYLKFLRQLYGGCRPSAALNGLVHFHWPRIYTTNIDDAVEAAFRAERRAIEVVSHNAPVRLYPQTPAATQYIKLNGDVSRLENGVIFTEEDYFSYHNRIDTWYEELARDFMDYTFLFIGTKLNEPLFWHHIRRLAFGTGMRAGIAFLVAPHFSPNVRLSLSERGIHPLEGSLADVVEALRAKLGRHLTSEAVLEARNDAVAVLRTKTHLSTLTRFSEDLNSLTVVNRRLLSSQGLSKPIRVRSFYYGSQPTWRDVLDEIPARLKIMEEISKALSSDAAPILIHGPAGSGKSTALMMAALEYATENPDVLVLWTERIGDFPSGLIRAIDQAFEGDILLLVDDAGKVAEEIGKLVRDGVLSRTRLVLCERTNIWRRASIDAEGFKRIRVARIDGSDVGPILEKLRAYGPWGYLGGLKPEERARVIYDTAKRQLLVGLREATSGMGYDKILAHEYQSIPAGYAFEAINIVAVASAHRLAISERTFRMAIVARGFDDIPADLTEGLEEITFLEHGYLRSRHPIIAEYLVGSVVTDEDAFAAVAAILEGLSRFGSPLRRTARGPEARLFSALTNHEFLFRRFARRPADVLALYDRLSETYGDDALLLMQQALFEQSCGGAKLEDSLNHIREALAIWPDSF